MKSAEGKIKKYQKRERQSMTEKGKEKRKRSE
jgi:hypothetical protein